MRWMVCSFDLATATTAVEILASFFALLENGKSDDMDHLGCAFFPPTFSKLLTLTSSILAIAAATTATVAYSTLFGLFCTTL
jgi:hypothetical protein